MAKKGLGFGMTLQNSRPAARKGEIFFVAFPDFQSFFSPSQQQSSFRPMTRELFIVIAVASGSSSSLIAAITTGETLKIECVLRNWFKALFR